MKNVRAAAVLYACFCAAAASLHAQANIRAGQEGQGKPYTITVSLRQEYDDNINTVSTREQDSWKTIVSPSFLFNYPMENTTISFGINFGVTYYWDRPDDDVDFSHLFTARVNHKFSDRFQLDIREQFRFAQESEVRNGAAIQRFLGDGFSNTFTIDGTAQWTERFSTVTGYSNNVERYDDSTINLVNDQMTHTVRQDFQFTVLPTTTAVLAYNYETTDYTDGSPFGSRDFDIHRGTVGADHYLLESWLVSGRAGGEYVTYGNELLNDGLNPYVDLSTAWTYLPGSRLRASYNYATNLTDDAFSGTSQGHTLMVELSHAITQKLTVSADGRVMFQTLERDTGLGAADSENLAEDTFSFGLNLTYAFTDYLSAEVGYKYSSVSSEDDLREYDRNQIYFGITGKY